MYILPDQTSVSRRLAQLFPSPTRIALTLQLAPNSSDGVENPKPPDPSEVSPDCLDPTSPNPSPTPESSTAVGDSVRTFSNPSLSFMLGTTNFEDIQLPTSPDLDPARSTKKYKILKVPLPVKEDMATAVTSLPTTVGNPNTRSKTQRQRNLPAPDVEPSNSEDDENNNLYNSEEEEEEEEEREELEGEDADAVFSGAEPEGYATDGSSIAGTSPVATSHPHGMLPIGKDKPNHAVSTTRPNHAGTTTSPNHAGTTTSPNHAGKTTSYTSTTTITTSTTTTSNKATLLPASYNPTSGQKNPASTKLDVEDCLEFMVKFAEQSDITRIILQLDPGVQYNAATHQDKLRETLRPQAQTVANLPQTANFVNREFLVNFALLSLYDLAVLVDDSQSMAFDEKGERIQAMKAVLRYLADIYALTAPDRGIRAIRFLNGNDDDKANNLKGDDVVKIVNNHSFEGLTKIGTALMQKLLKPFVFEQDSKWNKATKDARPLRKLERPLLIMVITDGAVEGEPSVRLPQAISMVHDSLRKAGFMADSKAVVFQFARVGNDERAKKYLTYLDDHSKVKDVVDTMSGSDLMDVIDWRKNGSATPNEALQRKMLKLLLGPILENFDNDIKDIDEAEDDFDDDEEDGGDWEKF